MPKPGRAPRPAPGRRAHKADSDARGQLLDVATALFAERGIANTTVAQIARAGGVTSAMVHYWFDTREQLLDALVEERLAPRFSYIWDVAGREDLPAAELVERIMRRMLEVTGKLPWLPSLWLREVVNEGGLLRERVLQRVPLQHVTAFNQAMATGKERGELNSGIEPALIFISILALVMLPQATARIWHRVNPHVTLDHGMLQRHVAALLMQGIASRSAARAPRPKKPGRES